MFLHKLVWTSLLLTMVLSKIKQRKKISKPMPEEKYISCDEFGQSARFNPYSVLNDRWLVFYYYGPNMPVVTYSFRVPSRREISYLHFILDGHLPEDFDWGAKMLLNLQIAKNETVLLVERNSRGRYWMYIPTLGLKKGQMTTRYSVQLKQTSDNRYLAMMICDRNTVYIMARLSDVPIRSELAQEAKKLGYHGRDGRSYLYQGSQWMPIEDEEEENVWGENTPTERSRKKREMFEKGEMFEKRE